MVHIGSSGQDVVMLQVLHIIFNSESAWTYGKCQICHNYTLIMFTRMQNMIKSWYNG